MTHILLIEPDRMLGRTYREALETDGHIVKVCAGAQATISAADTVRPDIIIMELQLVGHNGVEFLYEFRSYADWQNIPVIIHTQVPANEFAGSRDLLMHDLGVREYLYKPYTTLQMLRRSVADAVPVQ